VTTVPLTFDYAARSDVGMVRANNEDSGYAGPHLLALADGMGGHAGGDVASSMIIGALADLDGEALSGVEAPDALVRRIRSANARLGERTREDPTLEGMGTTLIALLRARDKLVLTHIGDSRAFLRRDGAVTQITKDHSFVQTLVDDGRITPEEAHTHPQRSLVTRVLTGAPDDEPDLVVRQALVGDRYLIASDGLTDYVARDTIDEVLLAARRPPECAERLVQLALRAGAPDNVTVVIGDVVDLIQGPVPTDVPVVVGAATVTRRGTRPIPVTPAEKAAALTQEAIGATDDEEDDDEVQLAEEGPRSRGARLMRAAAALAVTLVVLAGAGYAGWLWVQTQYWLGVDSGRVVLNQGVDQSLGPISLSHIVERTTISPTDLPDLYRDQLTKGVAFSSESAARAQLRTLEVQAKACRWFASQGQPCQPVSGTWVAPTPSPSPSLTPSPSAGTPTPKASASAGVATPVARG